MCVININFYENGKPGVQVNELFANACGVPSQKSQISRVFLTGLTILVAKVSF